MSIIDSSLIEQPTVDAAKSAATTKKKSASKTKKTTTKSARKTTTRRRTTQKYSKTGIPGLSIRFSWKEFLGITKLKRMFTKKTGIPTTQAGIERKIGNKVVGWLKKKVNWKE